MPLPPPSEHFDIPDAGVAVICERVKYSDGRFTLDRSQLVSSRLRPRELHLNPNSRRTSSCGTTFPVRISSRALAIAAASPSETGSSSGGADRAARYAGL